MLLGFALATLVGLSLGVFGGGGSILTVPIFVYALGFPAKQAIAMSLPVVGITSLIGAIGHWRAGNVHARIALIFGGAAMVGAFAGARFAALLSGSSQLLLLSIVMLVAAVSMFTNRSPVDASRDGVVPTGHASVPVLAIVGLAVGGLTGVVGIGGGFLIVPALVMLARTPMKQAVGTSIVIIALNAIAGAAGYLGQVTVPWGFMAEFTAFAVGGILAGTWLVQFVAADVLRRAFAIFLLAMGGLVFYQNRRVMTGQPGVVPAAVDSVPTIQH